jgi:hypothetical protein
MMLREGNCFAHWHIGFTLAGRSCLRSDTCKDEEAMDIADRVAGAIERPSRRRRRNPLVVFNAASLLVGLRAPDRAKDIAIVIAAAFSVLAA